MEINGINMFITYLIKGIISIQYLPKTFILNILIFILLSLKYKI